MAETTASQSASVEVKPASGVSNYFALIVIVVSILVGELLYHLVFGAPSNFVDNNPENHPVADGIAHWFGLFYKGGFIIPIAIGIMLMNLVFAIERWITLNKAAGSGSMDVFVQKIQIHLENNDVDAAIRECDTIKGSVGNVIKEVLRKYREVINDSSKDKEAKMAAVQKALEESVALELPMLEKHLVIIATIVSVATLVGLIGTVIGMIKAFAALGNAGAPDASALAVGISEALINTMLGITTSTIATVFYNYFTSKIDAMTYKIDEAGYSIVQSIAEKS